MKKNKHKSSCGVDLHKCADDRTAELERSNEQLRKEIEERKRTEEELIRAQKLESVGILAGGIAHDFNNMIAAILGNISLAKMHVSTADKIFTYLADAENVCMRTCDLTNQLITFSKGEKPVKKTFSVGALVKSAARFSLSGSNVHCEFHMPSDLWPVEVDEGQMRQVIHNIVVNACDAMPEGGIIDIFGENITVGAEGDFPLREGRFVKVSIQDHGAGISKDNLSKIFDPYFTTKTRNNRKGMGLGLAICYSIINKHEGHIAVESEEGNGATFHIYLPASLKEGKKEEKPVAGNGKILIMDDEEPVRLITGEFLRHIGYEVELVKNGEEALSLYKKAKEANQHFDVVILDLTVPGGMGGKNAIKKLLEIDPGVKGILASGYSDDPIMQDFSNHGFVGAIAKPYAFDHLHELIKKVMSQKKL